MTRRVTPIITNQIYHIFNRGIASQPIFSSVYDYRRFIELIDYYRYTSPTLRFSFYRRLPDKKKQKYYYDMKNNKSPQIEIFAYCLMPNHYHFVIKEINGNGISKFIANLQNSYAKYFNIRNNRTGSLFSEMFKNVRVDKDEQFIHLVRYIHLNPLTSYIIKKPEELDNYPWSSLPFYLFNSSSEFLERKLLLSYFKNIKELDKFTKDQIGYQRQIHHLRYLTLE